MRKETATKKKMSAISAFVLIFVIVVPISTDSAMPEPENDNHKNQAVVSHVSPPREALLSDLVVVKTYNVFLTAYSSAPGETDDSPEITASGIAAKDGIVAANFLPFGAKIKIPDLFGEKVFVVQDRLHRRKKRFVDIWMPSRKKALKFGIKRAEILLVN